MQLFKQFWCHTNSFSSLKLIPVLKVQSTEEDTTPLISTHYPKIIKISVVNGFVWTGADYISEFGLHLSDPKTSYTRTVYFSICCNRDSIGFADIQIIFVTVHPEVFGPGFELAFKVLAT